MESKPVAEDGHWNDIEWTVPRRWCDVDEDEEATESPYEERRYPCNLCNKRFPNSTSLGNHQRIHNNEKPLNCLQQRIAQLSNYTSHIRIHTGERPYKCTLCPKAFSQSNSLRFTSEGSRTIDDILVQRAAKGSLSDMKKHKRVVHGPILCSLCNERFASKFDF